MTLDSKKLADLVESDIQALIPNGDEEGRELDYKEQLKIGSDSDRKEFLAPSAFAVSRMFTRMAKRFTVVVDLVALPARASDALLHEMARKYRESFPRQLESGVSQVADDLGDVDCRDLKSRFFLVRWQWSFLSRNPSTIRNVSPLKLSFRIRGASIGQMLRAAHLTQAFTARLTRPVVTPDVLITSTLGGRPFRPINPSLA